MRAAVYVGTGDVDVIEIRDVAEPQPGSDDIVVDVAYAGLNRADLLERQGRYGPPPPAGTPWIPGLEYAGTVSGIGDRVTGFAPGDRVCGIVTGGAHAERIAVHAATACHIPDRLDLRTAAAIPEAFMTAYDALVRLGGFAIGQTVVIHAIGSGVGLAALMLAKHGGGKVLGTSRTLDKIARAFEFLLDGGVLFDQDWPARAHEMTGGRGADLVLDFIGISAFERNVAALATEGRIIQIGTLGGNKGTIAFGSFMAKRITLVGTVLRGRPIEQKIALARTFQRYVIPRVGNGTLHPVVDRAFPLDEIRAAHTYIEQNKNFGKVLLQITAPSNP